MRNFLLISAVCALASAAFAQVIPTYTNETGTRLPDVSVQTDSGLPAGSVAEKDFGIGDFDQDGDDDVVIGLRAAQNSNADQPRASVLLRNDSGVLNNVTSTLAPALLTARRTRDVLVEDVDGDGDLDVMLANGTGAATTYLENMGGVGPGWLGFVLNTTDIPNTIFDAWSISAGDLVNDGDNFPDIFIGNGSTGNDTIWVNNGAGVFTDQGAARLGANGNTSRTRSSAIVDMNLDGDMDIIQGVTNPTGAARMLKNDGTGVFTAAVQNLATGSCYNFATGDLNNDGRSDVVAVRNASDQYILNTGTSGENITLGAAVTVPNSNGFGSIARIADLNTDGDNDFLICDLDQEFPVDCTRRLKLYFNTGGSPLIVDGYPTPQPWNMTGVSDVAPMDIDGDGDLDLLIGHCTGTAVWMQDGSPTAPCPGDRDGDGDVDLGDLGIVLANFGMGPGGDQDGDGDTDLGDLGVVLSAFGVPCP